MCSAIPSAPVPRPNRKKTVYGYYVSDTGVPIPPTPPPTRWERFKIWLNNLLDKWIESQERDK